MTSRVAQGRSKPARKTSPETMRRTQPNSFFIYYFCRPDLGQSVRNRLDQLETARAPATGGLCRIVKTHISLHVRETEKRHTLWDLSVDSRRGVQQKPLLLEPSLVILWVSRNNVDPGSAGVLQPTSVQALTRSPSVSSSAPRSSEVVHLTRHEV